MSEIDQIYVNKEGKPEGIIIYLTYTHIEMIRKDDTLRDELIERLADAADDLFCERNLT